VTITGEIVAPDIKLTPGAAPGVPAEGQVYYDSTDHTLKFRDASAWISCAAIVSMHAFGSTPNDDGATISGGQLTLQPADTTHSGGVTAIAQTFGGVKTFSQIISPILNNTNGTLSTDICVKLGTSNTGTLDALAKLLSIRSAIGGTEVEKMYVGASGNIVVADADAYTAIKGTSTGANGVWGISNAGNAVRGDGGAGGAAGGYFTAYGGYGVYGSSQTTGVYGTSGSGHGVKGVTTGGGGIAVWGVSSGSNGPAVKGESSSYFGVVATGTGNYSALQVTPRASLPSSVENGAVTIRDDGSFNWYANGTWKTLSGSGSTDVTLAAIGATPNANGASLVGQILNLQPASISFGGAMTTAAQSFAGAKTFTAAAVVQAPYAAVTDVYLKVGSSTADASVLAGAKLLSARTGIGGTEVEYFSVSKSSTTSGTVNCTPPSTGAADVLVKAGTSTADGSVNAAAKLLSVRTGVGGTEIEQLYVVKGGAINQQGTDSSATPGAATINKATGISAIASGSSTCTITNSLATTSSRILITWLGDHGAARSWVARAAGSFTVMLSSNAATNTSFAWEVSALA
jgi:hypothetical protein